MSHVFSPKRVRAVLAGVTLVLVGACSLPAPMLQQADDDPPTTQPPAGEEEIDAAKLEEFYSQTVAWEDCGTDQECATVTVPIDYAQPDKGTIDLALKKHATRSADGVVLFNPGGPGGSGVDLIDQARYVFTPELLTAKEVVGFDPRGVGQSAPISCYDDDQLDEFYTEVYDVETDEGFDAYVSSVADFVQACKDNNPETITHVDTISTARDMDVIRAALGVEKLDYLGFSYGTKLGAIYAELFGPHVGRFVLDGAMTLEGEITEITNAQVEGFEQAYREYLQDCLQGPGCPFDGGVDDAYDQTLELLDTVGDNPVETGDSQRPATEVDAMNAIIVALYDVETWPILSQALTSLQLGDGEQVKMLSDHVLERESDGTYAPSDGAMAAIQCLDFPDAGDVDRQSLNAQAQELEEKSPLFGGSMAYGQVACAQFGYSAPEDPLEISAEQAPTMMVIGTTGDPATPHKWAEDMVEQLADAVLVTWEGQGHLAYGKSSCINNAVDDFLIEGLLPEDGLRC